MNNLIKTSKKFPVPNKMKAWVLGNPNEFRTAVCCHLLDIICRTFGRYSELVDQLKMEIYASSICFFCLNRLKKNISFTFIRILVSHLMASAQKILFLIESKTNIFNLLSKENHRDEKIAMKNPLFRRDENVGFRRDEKVTFWCAKF